MKVLLCEGQGEYESQASDSLFSNMTLLYTPESSFPEL